MADLMIVKAKPNPMGRDRTPHITPQNQLAAEWIDIKNMGTQVINLNNLAIFHQTFDIYCRELRTARLLNLGGEVRPGEVVRIHSGNRIPETQLNHEDRIGADYHIFANYNNYVWNNACGDKPRIRNILQNVWVDLTYYDPGPPEGVQLRRVGNKLVP